MANYDPVDDLAIAHEMADAARAAVRPYFRSHFIVDNKLEGGFDPVTAADRASETAMRAVLARHVPEDGILGEEYGEQTGRTGRRWVLDPIDGTRAFIAGLPTWTVLIALEREGRPAIGVIDQPHIGERFTGWPGASAYRRGREEAPLKTRDTTRLADAILTSTDAYLFAGAEAEAFENIRRRARLCRFGFDAYGYAMLAQGGVDLVIESGLQIYDIQAFMPVVEGAGGVVTNWSGGDPSQGGQVVAAASRALLDEALEWLAPAAV